MMGTPPGRHIPMSVDSIDNNYGITPGLFFSFPCTCQGGEWRIVDGIPLDDAAREKLRIAENDLLDCKTCALESIKSSVEAN
jgi:malate dehydrogenase